VLPKSEAKLLHVEAMMRDTIKKVAKEGLDLPVEVEIKTRRCCQNIRRKLILGSAPLP